MTNVQSTTSVRQVALGQYADRATAALPATALGNIFTVTGGIIVTSLIGRVTTAIQNQACTLKVSYTPTVGSVADLSAVSATIAAAPVGTTFTLPAAAASALTIGPINGSGFALATGALFLPAGAMSITTSATNTGSVRWTLTYIPYDAGASVAAA